MRARRPAAVAWLSLAVVIAGATAACGSRAGGGIPSDPARRLMTLATTTSAYDSGLLGAVIPAFERAAGVRVKVVAVGSGEAFELGRRGDADVLLVHDPDGEARFVAEGHGLWRREVMRNDFVIVGPPEDPARIRGVTDAVAALDRLQAGGAAFVSRGDRSGTHSREMRLWQETGISPGGRWYLETGSGMGATLVVASEKGAYTLSDRATFLTLRERLRLEVLVEGDPRLENRYSVIAVNPAQHPGVYAEGAAALADFLTVGEGAGIIGRFGADRFGAPLFRPTGGGGQGSGG